MYVSKIKLDPTHWNGIKLVELLRFNNLINVVCINGSWCTSLRNRKFLRKFIPVQKPKEKRSAVEDFNFILTINRSTPSAPAMLPSVSVVEKPSTERAYPSQQRTPTSQALVPPSNITDGTTPLLSARQENTPPTSTIPCQLESSSPAPAKLLTLPSPKENQCP